MLRIRLLGVTSIAALLAAGASASAEEAANAQFETAYANIEEITVVGAAGGVAEVPGAVTYIDAEALEIQSYTDIQRILRRAPGINIQEEDGYGLRPNIGMRGSGADRSSRISIQEDGVPIAPAPYAAPSAYYFPYAGRLNSIEIAKGPAVIQYGPRTSGGALNLFSTPIPEETSGSVTFLYGSDDARRLHAWAGVRGDAGPFDVGLLVETLQYQSDGFKEIDAGGETGFDIDDYVIKFGLFSHKGAQFEQSLVLKYQRSDEVSNETYLGLSIADFSAQPNRRYNASAGDQFKSDHETFQANYKIDFNNGLKFALTGYHTEFERDWFKLERVFSQQAGSFISTSGILSTISEIQLGADATSPDALAALEAFEILVGAPGFTSSDDALDLRHNARQYEATGVQGVIGYEFQSGQIEHNIEASLRWHEDSEDRRQWNEFFRIDDTQLQRTSQNLPGNQTNRLSTADALAGYIQDNFDWGRLHGSVGVRVEQIDLVRNDFLRTDPDRTLGPSRVRENSILVVLPGAGLVYDLTDDLSVLGGVYRGFAPPGPGSSANEEQSLIYETGFRFDNGAASLEVIGYINAFENLVGTCTASTGGGCDIGDQFDAGEVDVRGIELTGGLDAGKFINAPFAIPLTVVYTLTDASFQNSFSSNFDPWGDVVAGDELPYVADHQLVLAAGVEGDRWGMEAGMFYQSERRAIAGQGDVPELEKLDAHTVVDISGWIEIVEGVKIRGKLENVFDEVYVAAQRPAGFRPGLPRTFFVGADISF